MELVDQLLVIFGPNSGFASRQLVAAGYAEDEIRGAWNFARAAGYTESTGLGADRFTAAGRDRAAVLRRRLLDMAASRDLEGEFRRSVCGQARAAKASGEQYFQVILGISQPYQVWSLKHKSTRIALRTGAIRALS